MRKLIRPKSLARRPTLNLGASFLSGFVFAVGLGVSGMLNPSNVVGFLDLSKDWKPALAFVMVGAIFVYLVSHQISHRMKKPFGAMNWKHLPKVGADLKWKVALGNAMFGIGWGLTGYCPGPALVSLPSLQRSTWVFFLSMVAGFFVWEFRGFIRQRPNLKQTD
jgi:uncharacterized protein